MSKKAINLTLGWVIGLGILGLIIYWAVTAPRVPVAEYEATNGLHYHPHLTIIIDGAPVSISANIGLIGGHNPIHTHDADGTIHLEFQGRVKRDDIRLGKFFQAWGKEWTDASFMGLPLEGHTLTMKVDGVTSTEYQNLLMQDGKKIELVYQ